MLVLRRFLAPLALTAALVLVVGAPASADDGDNRHPSGEDRSAEAGASGTQGKSPSDPDGMSNGGVDKPGGQGGIDRDDQDGNNGCGNDDDFEDDNNGNCLGRQKAKARGDEVRSSHGRDGGAERDTAAVNRQAAGADAVAPEAALEREEAGGEARADAEHRATVEAAAPATVVAAQQPASATRLLVADRVDVAPQVLGVSVERPVEAATVAPAVAPAEQVMSAQTTRGGGAGASSLARTGFTVLTLVAIALTLVAVGILVRRAAAARR